MINNINKLSVLKAENSPTIRWSLETKLQSAKRSGINVLLPQINTQYPDRSGIYVFAIELKDSRRQVFYIGKAEDIRKRINEHLSLSELNDCIKYCIDNYPCVVTWALIENKIWLNNIERTLYEHYLKKCISLCNVNKPTGEIIPINFPLPY